MTANNSIETCPVFKKAFWEWFDKLSLNEKERFWKFPHDFACLYFYNKYYKNMQKRPSGPTG